MKMKTTTVHPEYAKLKTAISLGLNVYLVGPAGSGKTTAVHNVAKEIAEDTFYSMSVCAQSTKTDLLGYSNALGNYISTAFRRAYEFGGVFLLDEVDNGNANVLNVLNAALANGFCSFPDGMIQRHPEFRCVAAGNTYGMGANRRYIGRQQLDAASLDRFVVIDWGYDETLERSLVKNERVAELVQSIRYTVDALALSLVVSPRASMALDAILPTGIPLEDALQICVWKGQLDKASIEKIMAGDRVIAARKALEPQPQPKPAPEKSPNEIAKELQEKLGQINIQYEIQKLGFMGRINQARKPRRKPGRKNNVSEDGRRRLSEAGKRSAETRRLNKLRKMGLLP